jgi:hypothetical protein
VNNYGVKFRLPEHLADKVATFGESSYGATLVTLVLKDGTRIPHVSIAWGSQVIKAKGSEEEKSLSQLDSANIVDVLPEP